MKRCCRKKVVRFLGAVLMVFALAGCAQFTLVQGGKRIPVGNAFMVDTSMNWSKHDSDDVETWTVDGPRLQRLVFFKGIPDGKPLIKVQEKGESAPVFHASMTSVEMMELIVATLSRTGAHDVKVSDLRPHKLGTLDGFRFEFKFVAREGLRYEGFAAGAQKDQKFVGVMYIGTALYHYKKHHDEIEKILASLTVP